MSPKGYISIPRSLFDSQSWSRRRVYSEIEAAIYLYQSVDMQGNLTISKRSLANIWLWEETKVLRFIHRLENTGYITTSKNISGTQIHINDYENTVSGASAPPSAPLNAPLNDNKISGLDIPDAPLNAPPSAPPKIEKEKEQEKKERDIKNKKEKVKEKDKTLLYPAGACVCEKKGEPDVFTSILNAEAPPYPPKGYEDFDLSFIQPSFKEVFFSWLEYKKERRDKRYTPRGLKIAYNRLYEYSFHDPDIAKQIIEQSISNNWAGFFELKTKQNNNDTDHQQAQRNQREANAAALVERLLATNQPVS